VTAVLTPVIRREVAVGVTDAVDAAIRACAAQTRLPLTADCPFLGPDDSLWGQLAEAHATARDPRMTITLLPTFTLSYDVPTGDVLVDRQDPGELTLYADGTVRGLAATLTVPMISIDPEGYVEDAGATPVVHFGD
jgi:hypothetical protein